MVRRFPVSTGSSILRWSELPQNSVLTELYESLRSRQQRVAVRALNVGPHRLDTINAQHRALVAALDESDADKALEILAAHLRPVPEVLALLPADQP